MTAGKLPRTIKQLLPTPGMSVLVVGLGTFGGGIGVVRYLVEQGVRVIVTDMKPASELAKSIRELQDLPVELHLGSHDESDLDLVELVVASPAVPPQSSFLEAARQRGLPITSEMNLFFSQCPGKIIGISGSNGKTTTTHLTAEILRQSGLTVHIGGNLGRSLLGKLPSIAREDRVVLELSSFQLADLDRLGLSPAVSVLTNLTPNHLDRHGTFDAYCHAKQTLFRHQGAEDVAILNADDEQTAKRVADHCAGQLIWFSTHTALPVGFYREADRLVVRDLEGVHELASVDELSIPGEHNQSNLLAAAAAAIAAGANPNAVRQAAKAFEGVPHRLQLVGQAGARRFYNDSIATTPESTIAALHALPGPLYLLVGGYDKGCELNQLADVLSEKASGVVLLGALGQRLARLLKDSGLQTSRAASFREAFDALLAMADNGSLILSPAAASYDEFNNFTERGELFSSLVAEQLGTA